MKTPRLTIEKNFEGHALGTSVLPGWDMVSGAWKIGRDDGTRVVEQTRPMGDNMYALLTESYSGDFAFEARVKMTGTNRWGCGLVFRYRNPGDLYQFEMWDVHPFLRFWAWKDYRYSAAGGTDLPEPVSLNTWYRMRVACTGDRYVCSLEPGGIVFEVVESTYREGCFGLNAAGPIRFDSIRIDLY